MTHGPLLSGLLAASPRKYADIAGARMTHADLLGAASAVAASVRPGERVAVAASPTAETVVGVVGALLAGATVVPVAPDAGVSERAHVLRDSGARELGPVDLAARAEPPPANADPTLLLYTSGTTGPPKGVLLPARALAAGLDALADAWAWTAADVLAHGLPLHHVHGLVLGVLGPLRLGGSLQHVGRPTPEAYAAAAGHGATMFFGVPTIWSRIAAAEEHARALSGARLLVSGSAALPVTVHERIRELTGLRIFERYGMSETLITVATRSDAEPRPGWVGVPVHGVEARVVDDEGQPAIDTMGALDVRGATLFDGYLGLPSETAAAWTDDGWFRTGDVAVASADGWLRIVGRASVDLIKTGGHRVGAGEVEAALLGHPAIAECAVVGEPDDDLGQRIVAYVVAAAPVEAEALTAYVSDQLARHKRPREVRFVDALPRNDLGKVQKGRLVSTSRGPA